MKNKKKNYTNLESESVTVDIGGSPVPKRRRKYLDCILSCRRKDISCSCILRKKKQKKIEKLKKKRKKGPKQCVRSKRV